MEFKIGDRVRIKDDYHYYKGRSGKFGTVVDNPGKNSSPGICHDDYIGGHNCNGHCPEGYGWYYNSNEIELSSSPTDTLILLL
jgi:hypothetical protein